MQGAAPTKAAWQDSESLTSSTSPGLRFPCHRLLWYLDPIGMPGSCKSKSDCNLQPQLQTCTRSGPTIARTTQTGLRCYKQLLNPHENAVLAGSHLAIPHIHPNDRGCPSLQQAVGEAPSGDACVQALEVADVHLEVVQCCLQLQASPVWEGQSCLTPS